MKLEEKHRQLLKLWQRSTKTDGWAKVSDQVWPAIQDAPKELMTLEKLDSGGRAKLTQEGEIVLKWIC